MHSSQIHQRASISVPMTIQNIPVMVGLDQSRLTVSSKKLQNINCILEPSESLGGLYLGDIISTMKQDLIRSYRIKAVLSCMSQNPPITNIITLHKKLSIKDLVNFPIINHFDEAIGWIDERRAEKVNVLVHCHAGVSRSVSIVIAYLIRKHEWSPVQALQFVKQRRERAKPNVGFWNQLNQYYNFWTNKAQQTQKNRQIRHSFCSKENQGYFQHYRQRLPSQQSFLSDFSGQNKKVQQICEEKQPKQQLDQPQKKSTNRRRKIFEKKDLLQNKVVNSRVSTASMKDSQKDTNFQTHSILQNKSVIGPMSEDYCKERKSIVHSKMSMRQSGFEQNSTNNLGRVNHINYPSQPSHFAVNLHGLHQPRSTIDNLSWIRPNSGFSNLQMYPSILDR